MRRSYDMWYHVLCIGIVLQGSAALTRFVFMGRLDTYLPGTSVAHAVMELIDYGFQESVPIQWLRDCLKNTYPWFG